MVTYLSPKCPQGGKYGGLGILPRDFQDQIIRPVHRGTPDLETSWTLCSFLFSMRFVLAQYVLCACSNVVISTILCKDICNLSFLLPFVLFFLNKPLEYEFLDL